MSAIIAYFPQLIQGLLITLQISIGGFLLGLLLGTFITFLWDKVPAFIRYSFTLYISFIRGIPEILIICLFYYGSLQYLSNLTLFPVKINGIFVAICALGAVSSAYFVEILRGALNTIPVGQAEAATSLGLGRSTTFIRIIMPQIFIFAWPAIGNQWLIILKDSALVAIVGYEDLLRKATVGGTAVRSQMTFYIAAALIYIAVTALSTILFKSGEKIMSQRR